MLYHNTLHPDIKVSLKEAVMTCIGIDNGLYMPDFIPVLPRAVINNIPGMSIIEIGYLVAGTLFDKVIPLDIVHSLSGKLDISGPDKRAGNGTLCT